MVGPFAVGLGGCIGRLTAGVAVQITSCGHGAGIRSARAKEALHRAGRGARVLLRGGRARKNRRPATGHHTMMMMMMICRPRPQARQRSGRPQQLLPWQPVQPRPLGRLPPTARSPPPDDRSVDAPPLPPPSPPRPRGRAPCPLDRAVALHALDRAVARPSTVRSRPADRLVVGSGRLLSLECCRGPRVREEPGPKAHTAG